MAPRRPAAGPVRGSLTTATTSADLRTQLGVNQGGASRPLRAVLRDLERTEQATDSARRATKLRSTIQHLDRLGDQDLGPPMPAAPQGAQVGQGVQAAAPQGAAAAGPLPMPQRREAMVQLRRQAQLALARNLVDSIQSDEVDEPTLAEIMDHALQGARPDHLPTTVELVNLEAILAYVDDARGEMQAAQPPTWSPALQAQRDRLDRLHRRRVDDDGLLTAQVRVTGPQGTSGSYFIGGTPPHGVFKPALQEDPDPIAGRQRGENARNEVVAVGLGQTVFNAPPLRLPLAQARVATLSHAAIATRGTALYQRFATQNPPAAMRNPLQTGALIQYQDSQAPLVQTKEFVVPGRPGLRYAFGQGNATAAANRTAAMQQVYPLWNLLTQRQRADLAPTDRFVFVTPNNTDANAFGDELAALAVFNVATVQLDSHGDNVLLGTQPRSRPNDVGYRRLLPVDQGLMLPDLDGAIDRIGQAGIDVWESWARSDQAHTPFTPNVRQAALALDPMALTAETRRLAERATAESGGTFPAIKDEQLLVQQLTVRCMQAILQADPAASPADLADLMVNTAGGDTPFTIALRVLRNQRDNAGGTVTQAMVDNVFSQFQTLRAIAQPNLDNTPAVAQLRRQLQRLAALPQPPTAQLHALPAQIQAALTRHPRQDAIEVDATAATAELLIAEAEVAQPGHQGPTSELADARQIPNQIHAIRGRLLARGMANEANELNQWSQGLATHLQQGEVVEFVHFAKLAKAKADTYLRLATNQLIGQIDASLRILNRTPHRNAALDARLTALQAQAAAQQIPYPTLFDTADQLLTAVEQALPAALPPQ